MLKAIPILFSSSVLLLILANPLLAEVEEVPRARVRSISKQIDSLIEAQLKRHDEKPNRLVDDETFLRRIYLDVVGRIPTYAETRGFLESKGRDRRANLIDSLLDSPGYVSHQFNYWADVLRIKSRLQGGNPGKPYIDFVKGSLAANQPYDEFVRDLITSEGPALERGNGATGYYLRDQGMPEDNMANTVRVFLGTRLECAQCHDHPFDKWTQREFFEMVAFTGGMQTRMSPNGMSSGMDLRRRLRQTDANAQVKQVATNLLRPLSYGVRGSGTGLARLPDSYQYDDGEPNEIVTAKTMFEHQELVQPTVPVSRKKKRRRNNNRYSQIIPGAEDIGSREVFADWMTSPDNPRFTTVIVNRLWKRALGIGLIEPLDDINDATVASNEELMRYLEQQMVDLDYDMKQFSRAIYNSRTYQREAEATDLADVTEYHFPGPVLRRLSAEQLWDSFLSLAVPNLDTRDNPRTKVSRLGYDDIYEGYEKARNMSLDEILELAEQQLEIRNDPEKRRKRYRESMIAMEKKDDPFAKEAQALKQKLARLKQLQNRAKRQKKHQVSRMLQAKMREVSNQLRHIPTRISGDLVRASEVQSPAPAGHFLREFGQSDRDQIENGHAEPAVSQVLSLMNGQIEKKIISNPRTVLMRNVVMADSPNEKIDVIYLSMLSRKPTREERQMWLSLGKQNPSETANDLIWTLANTSEFMFVH